MESNQEVGYFVDASFDYPLDIEVFLITKEQAMKLRELYVEALSANSDLWDQYYTYRNALKRCKVYMVNSDRHGMTYNEKEMTE